MTPVHWDDVQAERQLAERELREWIQRAFHLDEHTVAVGKHYADPTEAELSARVLVLWDVSKGQFPFRVNVIVRDESLHHVAQDPALDALARETGAKLIVFDDSPEPDHVVLIEPDGIRRGAYVDPDALNDDSYEIAFYEDPDQQAKDGAANDR